MVELLLDSVFNFLPSLANPLPKLSRLLGNLTRSRINVLLHMLSHRLSARKWIWLIWSIKSTRLNRSRLYNRPIHLCLTRYRRRLPRRARLSGRGLSTAALPLLLGRTALRRLS
jgi:hypothetical protein